jgi:hypothetical protein
MSAKIADLEGQDGRRSSIDEGGGGVSRSRRLSNAAANFNQSTTDLGIASAKLQQQQAAMDLEEKEFTSKVNKIERARLYCNKFMSTHIIGIQYGYTVLLCGILSGLMYIIQTYPLKSVRALVFQKYY